jgi:hypothetical protein
MTEFWVFQHEDRRVIHREGCDNCALWREREVPGAMWHGPYWTYMEAKTKANRPQEARTVELPIL